MLDSEEIAWQQARAMVAYREPTDIQWSLRYLDADGTLGGVASSDRLEELTTRFREEYDELTGLTLKRFRMTIEETGSFIVEYFYDNPPFGRVKWGWPGEN